MNYVGEYMFESTSKFPKFFVYILLLLAVMIFAGMFFSFDFVTAIYFITLIVSCVALILDKKYGTILTNYKLMFFLFDMINLIAVIAIIYYEWTKHTLLLNILLICLIAINIALMAIDMFLISNKNLTKNENLAVDIVKFGSMVCVLTYFFKVSILFYAIDALIFEISNLALKIYVNYNGRKPQTQEDEDTVEDKIVSIIRSSSDEKEVDQCE